MTLLQLVPLLALLSSPARVWAQQPAPQAAPPMPAHAKPANPFFSLRNAANPHYLVLRELTPAYHQVADTLSNRYAFRLLPGTRVYLYDWVPGGCLMRMTDEEGNHYYLPGKYLARLPVMVEL